MYCSILTCYEFAVEETDFCSTHYTSNAETGVASQSSQGLSAEEHDAYSRQIAAYGVEMMMRLKSLDVLLVGLQGVGMETAKNLVLSGPRSVTIFDPSPASLPDLGLNFFLTAKDCAEGRPRDVSVVKKLQELNPRTQVRTLFSGQAATEEQQVVYDVDHLPLSAPHGELDERIVGMFSVVIFAGNQHSRKTLLQWNRFCREHKTVHVDARGQQTSVESPIGFIACATFGPAAYMFSDFGSQHSVFDDDGQPATSRAIVSITNAPRGLVSIDMGGAMIQGVEVDDHSGWFEISGVKGMTSIDPNAPVKSINEGLWKFLGKQVTEKEESTRLTGEVPPPGDYKQFKYSIEESKGGGTRMVVKKTINSAFDFYIGDTTGFTPYEGGGVLTQKKVSVVKKYKSLADNLVAPCLVESDFSKMGRPEQLHVILQAIYDFQAKNNRLPGAADHAEVLELANAYNETMKTLRSRIDYGSDVLNFQNPRPCAIEAVDEKVLEKLVRASAAELQPLAAFMGGVVAQEAMKWTGKFDPLNQMFYVDVLEVLPEVAPNDVKPLGTGEPTRYDHQLALFGHELQQSIMNQRTFMVGCGALGCEYLKNFALLGLSAGPKGAIVVTDNDRIEVSNLNRQFLFREHNVGQMKSEAGKQAVLQMNPEMHIETHSLLVMPQSENIFNDPFWESLDFVTNALDNILARNYIDGRCVFYHKPLLESGTQGTMCNGLVVLPNQTISYTDGPKVDENAGGGIPMCTLRNFPNLVTHCVEWARAMFTDIFCAPFQDAQKFVANPAAFLTNLDEGSEGASAKLEKVKNLVEVLTQARNVTFDACVRQAFNLLHSMHRDNILNLIQQYPADAVDKETKQPFWSGSKRFPQAASWDISNTLETGYVIAVANILAVCYGLGPLPDGSRKNTLVPAKHAWRQVSTVAHALEGVQPKPFVPSSAQIALNDEEEKKAAGSEDDRVKLAAFRQTLEQLDTTGLVFQPADFEKDCDANFHIDFIAAATNLRAWNYQLETCSRDKAKVIAGRIIPAILTATAAITGLMACEMIKLVQKLPRAEFRDSSNDLATNSYRFSEPTAATKHDQKTLAKAALERDEKSLALERQKPWTGAPSVWGNRSLVKVNELVARIKSHQDTIRDSRVVPEGFTKWDQIMLEGDDKTVAQLIADLAAVNGKKVDQFGIGTQTLFSAEYERPFEEVAPGLAKRLLDRDCPPFLREQAYRVYVTHQAGKAINEKFKNATMRQAASRVGALQWPKKFLELSATVVDGMGQEWETPGVVFRFSELTSAEGTADAKSEVKTKPTKLQPDALKKVRRELRFFGKECAKDAAFGVDEHGDPAHCELRLLGPEGSPYEGGVFHFEYHFPDNYPFAPPKLRCLTKIFHCNFNNSGELCGIPQLKDAWSPSLSCIQIIQAVTSLLMSPSFGEPLVSEIAALHEKDPKTHDARAAEATKLYATYTPNNAIPWDSIQLDRNLLEGTNAGEVSETPALSPEEIDKALATLEADWKPTKWELLAADRRARYAARALPELNQGTVLAVSTADPSEEKVVQVLRGKAVEILGVDDILMSDVTPCELVEYKFEDSEWLVARISMDSLEHYRGTKFEDWRNLAMNMWKECISGFLRILKGGPICHMFDPLIFPEAPGEEKKWQVVDKHGKVRNIPHPVAELRIWKPDTKTYESVETRLNGAPSDGDLEAYWQNMLKDLQEITSRETGDDFMGDCSRLSEEDLKKKYA